MRFTSSSPPSHALFDIGSTSLLLANLGPEVLPQVYIGSALLLVTVGLFVIPVIDRVDRVRLFTFTLFFFAAALAALHNLGPRAPRRRLSRPVPTFVI